MQDKLHSAHQPECDPSLAVLSRSCTAFSVADFPRLVCILRNSSVTANDTRRRGDIQAFDARRSSQHPALVSRPRSASWIVIVRLKSPLLFENDLVTAYDTIMMILNAVTSVESICATRLA